MYLLIDVEDCSPEDLTWLEKKELPAVVLGIFTHCKCIVEGSEP